MKRANMFCLKMSYYWWYTKILDQNLNSFVYQIIQLNKEDEQTVEG